MSIYIVHRYTSTCVGAQMNSKVYQRLVVTAYVCTGCQHNCYNTPGSYYCTCNNTGYQLHSDKHKCQGKIYFCHLIFNNFTCICTIDMYIRM